MNVELLTEQHLEILTLKEGCTGSSESTPVKILHCWKAHVTAHIPFYVHPRKRHRIKQERATQKCVAIHMHTGNHNYYHHQ